VPAVPDQSTCDAFTDDPLSKGELTDGVPPYKPSMGSSGDAPFTGYHDWGEPRCFFHEEWGGADMWIVQDELVPLMDTTPNSQHYIVFWAPSDQLLGPPLHTAKWGAVFGDVGQSEEFSGTTIDAGECALPATDFYENECKNGFGNHPAVHVGAFGRRMTSHDRKLMHNWPECEPFIGVPIPNRYECASAPATVTNCASICHNHGASCPAGASKCGTIAEATECAETCSWQTCGTDGVTMAANFAQGPAGVGCPDHCMPAALSQTTSCADLKAAYKSSQCCGDSPDKIAYLSVSLNSLSCHIASTTCRKLKTAYKGSECCGSMAAKVASLPSDVAACAPSDCPLECLGDFSEHHLEPSPSPSPSSGSDQGSSCPMPACLVPDAPSFCALIPGCA